MRVKASSLSSFLLAALLFEGPMQTISLEGHSATGRPPGPGVVRNPQSPEKYTLAMCPFRVYAHLLLVIEFFVA